MNINNKEKKRIVHIERVKNLRNGLTSSLEAIDWEKIIKDGMKVVIKVNLCDTSPKRGVITSPLLVYNFVKLLTEKSCEVYVVESDGLLYSADEAYIASGLKIIEDVGGKFVNLTKDKKIPLKVKDTLFIKDNLMPKTLADADVFVTMPVLKTHEITVYTGALKNQFGCYPQHNRVLLHHRLDEAIVDINTILKPKLVIMDAITAIEGNGPTRGYPVNLNLLLVSNDPISCDLVALKIIGFSCDEVKHVNLARKLFPESDNYTISGIEIEKIKRKFKKPYDDLGNKLQKFILRNPLLTKIFFDTSLNRTIVKIGRIYRRWSLKDRTKYF